MFCSSGKDILFPVKAKADWFDLITDWAESSTGCSFGQVEFTFGLLVFLRHSSARIWTKGLVCVPKIPCLHSSQLSAVKLLYSQHHKIAENFVLSESSCLPFHTPVSCIIWKASWKKKTCASEDSQICQRDKYFCLSRSTRSPKSCWPPHLSTVLW